MVNDKMDELNSLQENLQELSQKLESMREERTELLRARFDLKEQRGYFRNQLREEGKNPESERVSWLKQKLEELQSRIEETDRKVEDLEQQIEEGSDKQEELREKIEILKQEAEQKARKEAEESEPEDVLNTLGRMFEKTMSFVEDTLQNVDISQVAQTVEDTAEKAARAASNAAADLERSFQRKKENTGSTDHNGNCVVCGVAVINGGDYRNLNVSGACRSDSSLSCSHLGVAGVLKVQGNIQCREDIRIGGSLQCDQIRAESFCCAGAAKLSGDLNAEKLKVPGSLIVGGNLKVQSAEINGSLRVTGDCEAGTMKVAGTIRTDGSIEAEQFSVRQAYPESKAKKIHGVRIEISQEPVNGFLNGILKSQKNFSCDSIEGEEIVLQGVTADIVRGARITVKENCKINHVEYTQSCSVDASSSVMTCTRI